MNANEIKSVSYFKAVSPLTRPIADATHSISEIKFIVTRIELNSGVIGEAYLLAFHYSPEAILGALKDIRPLAIGHDVSNTSAFLTSYEREAEYFGHSGIHRWAQGSINIAMWDAWGKTLEQPVWKLFGAHHQKAPLYGSGGWLSYTPSELIEEVTGYVARGFNAVKIKVGSSEIESDIERLRKVREAVGPKVKIMMDANQGCSLAQAIELSRKAADIGIHWFEEPINHQDFDGYRTLRQSCSISLAMGEREFDTVPLRELCARNAIDLWQPDILRLGSVEAWRTSAAFADVNHIPVLPHYYKEYDVPLLMTIPNACGAESFDWIDPIITNPIRMKDGFAYPNSEAGWGFSFKDEFLTEI